MAALVGTWRLAEWADAAPATQGLLIFTDDGWFSVQVAGAKGILVAEAGSYDLDGNDAAMTAELSLTADAVGARRPRRWRVSGDVLELQWDAATATRWHRASTEIVDSMGG